MTETRNFYKRRDDLFFSLAYDEIYRPNTERAIFRNNPETRKRNLQEIEDALNVVQKSHPELPRVTVLSAYEKNGNMFFDFVSQGRRVKAFVAPVPSYLRTYEAHGCKLYEGDEQAMLDTVVDSRKRLRLAQ